MKEYTIIKKPAVLDWAQIPALKIDEVGWNMPADGVSSTAQLCYDASALFVRLSTEERNIRAVYTDPLQYPNLDSCLEFFFSPVEGDGRYFNLEVNPNGLMFQGVGHGRMDCVRLIPMRPNITPAVMRTPRGWAVEYAVSLAYFTLFFPGFSLAPGRTMRANFYKCGDECVQPHYYSWNPMTAETPDFHRPEDFGRLILG